MTASVSRGSGVTQGALWGAAAEKWAALMEPRERPLFEAILSTGLFAPGLRVLDAGCGSGLFAELIAAHGCEIVGLDASEALLAIARRRNPGVSFHHGDLEALPFPGEHVDIVTGINAFQYADDPRQALIEARRVTRRGGHVVVATWGSPERCEAAAAIVAMKELLPPPSAGAPGPFALSDKASLEAFVTSANLICHSVADVEVAWQFEDAGTVLAAMLSAGPAVLAIQTSGRNVVSAAVERAIAPFRLANGGYRLENEFRFAVARRD
jgi:SAM-dependent methyltransferase